MLFFQGFEKGFTSKIYQEELFFVGYGLNRINTRSRECLKETWRILVILLIKFLNNEKKSYQPIWRKVECRKI